MCVICHKAAGAKLPSNQTFRDMWDYNPHGGGVMWRDGGWVRYRKGFMKYDDFERWLNGHRSMLEETECAFHFRITTHGGTSEGNCHPFPLDAKTDPHAIKGKCKAVMMHNGVLPLNPRSKDYSDTVELSFRAKESGKPMWYLESVAEFVGGDNRVLAFGPKETLFIGTWKERKEDKGCKYSNLNFDDCGLYGVYGCGFGGTAGRSGKSGKRGDFADNDPWGGDYDYYYSPRSRSWKDAFGHEVPFEYVDPNALTPMDEEEYWRQYDLYYGDGGYERWCDEQEMYDTPERIEAANDALDGKAVAS